MTQLYAEVVGDPIAHTKSPLIHGFWLEKLGIDARYGSRRVAAGDLAAYFAEKRADPAFLGCNVTLPHKVAALAHVDRASPLAARTGAINAVVRNADGSLDGGNTDATGFAEPLAGRHFASVAVVGAGGAARAVLAGLSTRRLARVTMLNRNVAKAQALLDDFGYAGEAVPLDAAIVPVDCLINASSLGMSGQPPLPPLAHLIADGGLAYDLVYAPLETQLLATARARGLATIDGLAMLIAQAAEAFAQFFWAQAPREHDVELRALLTA